MVQPRNAAEGLNRFVVLFVFFVSGGLKHVAETARSEFRFDCSQVEQKSYEAFRKVFVLGLHFPCGAHY